MDPLYIDTILGTRAARDISYADPMTPELLTEQTRMRVSDQGARHDHRVKAYIDAVEKDPGAVRDMGIKAFADSLPELRRSKRGREEDSAPEPVAEQEGSYVGRLRSAAKQADTNKRQRLA